MRVRTIAGLTALALVAGVGSGEIIYRSKMCRDAIGQCSGRGHLLALVNGRGIYETDVKAEMVADRYFSGHETGANSEEVVLERLIANEDLRQLSSGEPIAEAEQQREFDLLRDQFADEILWRKRLADSGVSPQTLRQRARESLASRQWVEQEITKQLPVNHDSVRNYYAQHSADFMQPVRLRASHIFLAAPAETPPEIVQAKQKLIESLASRLRDGEEFEALVWEESEDEASKSHGGDLGYFSRSRIPEDFLATVSQLKIGETGKPFRSLLGFHIVRVTEIKPARQMTLEEVRSEITASLTNQRRREAVKTFAAQLVGSSALRRDWFWN